MYTLVIAAGRVVMVAEVVVSQMLRNNWGSLQTVLSWYLVRQLLQ